MPHPWSCSKPGRMGHWAICFTEQYSCPWQGLIWMAFEGPFQPKLPGILSGNWESTWDWDSVAMMCWGWGDMPEKHSVSCFFPPFFQLWLAEDEEWCFLQSCSTRSRGGWQQRPERLFWPGALHPEQAPTQRLWEGRGAAAAAGLLQEKKA